MEAELDEKDQLYSNSAEKLSEEVKRIQIMKEALATLQKETEIQGNEIKKQLVNLAMVKEENEALKKEMEKDDLDGIDLGIGDFNPKKYNSAERINTDDKVTTDIKEDKQDDTSLTEESATGDVIGDS